MDKVKIGDTITKYGGVLTNEECDLLFNYTKNKTNNPVEDPNKVPWEMGEKSNTLYYIAIKEAEIRGLLKKYKDTLANAISTDLGIQVYPHLTTLVLWKPGQSMPRHVDDGNGYDRERDLGMRFITSVSYMNDDYDGGYTFVKNDGVNNQEWRKNPVLSFPNEIFEDYISKPEKGATIAFYADDRNAHGVTKLNTGDRVILSTWFTKYPEYKENDDVIVDNDPLRTSKRNSAPVDMSVINQEHKKFNSEMKQSWLYNSDK